MNYTERGQARGRGGALSGLLVDAVLGVNPPAPRSPVVAAVRPRTSHPRCRTARGLPVRGPGRPSSPGSPGRRPWRSPRDVPGRDHAHPRDGRSTNWPCRDTRRATASPTHRHWAREGAWYRPWCCPPPSLAFVDGHSAGEHRDVELTRAGRICIDIDAAVIMTLGSFAGRIKSGLVILGDQFGGPGTPETSARPDSRRPPRRRSIRTGRPPGPSGRPRWRRAGSTDSPSVITIVHRPHHSPDPEQRPGYTPSEVPPLKRTMTGSLVPSRRPATRTGAPPDADRSHHRRPDPSYLSPYPRSSRITTAAAPLPVTIVASVPPSSPHQFNCCCPGVARARCVRVGGFLTGYDLERRFP